MTQRGDIIAMQKAPGKWWQRWVAAVTGGNTVHNAVALSSTRCMEMHLTGLRVVKISCYKSIRVFRPPDRLQLAVGMAIDATWHKYRWSRYNYLQGIAQGVHRWLGFWIPFRKTDADNCSEITAYYAKICGENISDENRYDPNRIVDHLLMSGWAEIGPVTQR